MQSQLELLAQEAGSFQKLSDLLEGYQDMPWLGFGGKKAELISLLCFARENCK